MDQLVVAYTAHDSIEMDMIASNLLAEGIACEARVMRSWWDDVSRTGPDHPFGDGWTPMAPLGWGYAEILVDPRDLERAREIIRALLEGKMEGFPEE